MCTDNILTQEQASPTEQIRKMKFREISGEEKMQEI